VIWQGEDGYHFELKEINQKTGALTLKKISAMNFYKYGIVIRENPENHLLQYDQLFNQFIVDAFVKIETEQLRYIRCNQSKLRVDNYIHLKDAFFHDEDITNTGQKCILPSTISAVLGTCMNIFKTH